MNSETMLKLFSHNVKRLRLQAGLSQDDLASRCTRFHKQIAQIEDGTANVTLSMIVTMAQALEVEPGVLLQDSSSQPGQ